MLISYRKGELLNLFAHKLQNEKNVDLHAHKLRNEKNVNFMLTNYEKTREISNQRQIFFLLIGCSLCFFKERRNSAW